MRDKKYRLEMFSTYDHTGMERHLERMAERGWLVEKIGLLWRYRRVEPKKLTFSVCYFDKASQFDPEPGEEQRTFYDFCAHTGWTPAAANGEMQVFCNEREDPVPIATDPALEVENIHRTMKKFGGWLFSYGVLLLLALMQLGMLGWDLAHRPASVLSSNIRLGLLVLWPVLLLVIGVELGSYFSWLRRARQAAQQGAFLETRGHPVFQRVALALTEAAAVWVAVSELAGGSPAAVTGCVAGAVYLAVLGLVLFGVRGLLKRRRVSAKVNRTVTFGLYFAVCLLLAALIPALVIGAGRSGLLDREEAPEGLPLTVEELVGGEYELRDGWSSEERSALMTLLTVQQSFRRHVNGGSRTEHYGLSYTVVEVRLSFLYGMCRDQLLRQRDTRNSSRIPEESQGWYEPADPAPWGAEEAYRQFYRDIGLTNSYLLCYPGRVVEVNFDWEPTPEQMAVVAAKLGGGPL